MKLVEDFDAFDGETGWSFGNGIAKTFFDFWS